jgi:hypothetical protein
MPIPELTSRLTVVANAGKEKDKKEKSANLFMRHPFER